MGPVPSPFELSYAEGTGAFIRNPDSAPAETLSEQVARERATGWFRSVRRWTGAHPVAITIIGSLIVAVALIVGLWSKRGDFAAALGDAPIWILGVAVALQVIWLLARSEAWHVCVAAAGGAVSRRRLFRASSVGYLGQHLQRQLRRSACGSRRCAARPRPTAPASRR